MSSKTKIVVLHLKELIYTGIFAVLGILFIVLLIIMFLPKGKDKETTAETRTVSYVPGVYTTSLVLNDNTVDIAVTVDESNITDIRIVNLDEAVATMYPLIEPAFEDLASQICRNQSMDGITYSDDNKYTSLVLLDAISASLEKAKVGGNRPANNGGSSQSPSQGTASPSGTAQAPGQAAPEVEVIPEAAPGAEATSAAEGAPEAEAAPESQTALESQTAPEIEGSTEAEAAPVTEGAPEAEASSTEDSSQPDGQENAEQSDGQNTEG